VLGKNRRPWSIRQEQVVRARVFGHELSGLIVRATSLGEEGGKCQLCGRENREQVWVPRRDILAFERWLSASEAREFFEMPEYRRPFENPNLRNGEKIRFRVFGKEASGRVTAVRNASFNAVDEDGSDHWASLVPLDNFIARR
jgi:hypothetical protein